MNTGMNSLDCTQCGKRFGGWSQWRRHIRNHERSLQNCVLSKNENVSITSTCQKQPTCTICSNVFSSVGELRSHVTEHSSSEVLSCAACSKTFLNYGSFNAHMKRHRKAWLCEYCSKRFSHRYLLTQHARQAHRGIQLIKSPTSERQHVTQIDIKKELDETGICIVLDTQNLGKDSAGTIDNDSAGNINIIAEINSRPCSFENESFKVLGKKRVANRNVLCSECRKKFRSRIQIQRHIKFTRNRSKILCKMKITKLFPTSWLV